MADGQTKEIELLRILSINNKEFYIYTYNETTSNGLVKVYASLNEKNNDETNLVSVSDEDWTSIKGAMNQIITNGEVTSIKTAPNSGITIKGNRVIALTNEQKNAIEDKDLIVSTPVVNNNLSGISDIGTLDTDAPVSLNALNNNTPINNFIDETANTPNSLTPDNNLNTPNIPSVDNFNSVENTSTPNIPNIPSVDSSVPNPFESVPNTNNDFNSPFTTDINNPNMPVVDTPSPTNQVESVVEPVVQEPVNNVDAQFPFLAPNVNNNNNNIDEPVVNITNTEPTVNNVNVNSDDELDKLIEIAKNNLESSKMIYDSLVNYKNNK